MFGLFQKKAVVAAPAPVNKLREACLSLVDLLRDTVNWAFDCPVPSYIYTVCKNAVNYCKLRLAQTAATKAGKHYIKEADKKPKEGEEELSWFQKFKLRMKGRKFLAQAAICKTALKYDAHKNL